MHKPLLTLKPSIVNALVPLILRNLFYYLVIVLILHALRFTIKLFFGFDLSTKIITYGLLALLILIVVIPLLIRLIILSNTKYYFFRSHILFEFKLFIIRRKSVPYSQIANITTKISIWDRISKAGDITLHTSEDKAPDLVLYYLQNPHKIEKGIYRMVFRSKNPS